MSNTFLNNLLHADLIRLRLQATTKDDVIGELLDLATAHGHLPDRAAAARAVLERERTMSTGMADGIAIPHAKSDTVAAPVLAVGLKPEGVDFAAFDRQPSRIIVLVVSPQRNTGIHLRVMAEISKALRRAEVRQRVLDAACREEVIQALVEMPDA